MSLTEKLFIFFYSAFNSWHLGKWLWNRHVFAYNYFSPQYSVFSAAKIACKTKAEQNQVCEVGLREKKKRLEIWCGGIKYWMCYNFCLASFLAAHLHVYLVDVVTGNILFNTDHKRASGPVHLVHAENWIVVCIIDHLYNWCIPVKDCNQGWKCWTTQTY